MSVPAFVFAVPSTAAPETPAAINATEAQASAATRSAVFFMSFFSSE